MRKPGFPCGRDEGRVAELIARDEGRSDEEAVAEDEVAMSEPGRTVTAVPADLAPVVRDVLANRSRVAWAATSGRLTIAAP